MTVRVVLVGVGGVGRFHLVGLSAMDDCRIQVVDRSETAINETRELVARIGGKAPIEYLRDIGECWRDPDVTVVATQAAGRVGLVEALHAHGHRNFLLEKLVTQSVQDYDRLLALFQQRGGAAWVNTQMRYHPLAGELADMLRGQVVSLSAVGADMGLATSAIHFVSLFMFLTGGWNGRFNVQSISPQLLPNRRGADLVEFSGTILGADDAGSTIAVTNLPLAQPMHTITISSEPVVCFIDAVGGKWHLSRRSDNWQVRSDVYREPRASELTPIAIRDIIATGRSRLPTLAELYAPHRDLFGAFRSHLETVWPVVPEALPIT